MHCICDGYHNVDDDDGSGVGGDRFNAVGISLL